MCSDSLPKVFDLASKSVVPVRTVYTDKDGSTASGAFEEPLRSITWHPTTLVFIVSTAKSKLRRYHAVRSPSGEIVAFQVDGRDLGVKAFTIAFNHDGSQLLGCMAAVSVYNYPSLERTWSKAGHNKFVWGVSWAEGDRFIATGAEDKSIRFWDNFFSSEVAVIPDAHNGSVWDCQFFKGNSQLLTSGADSKFKVWATGIVAGLWGRAPSASWSPLHTVALTSAFGYSMAVHPSDCYVLVGGGPAELISTDTWSRQESVHGSASRVAWSYKFGDAVCSSGDGEQGVWVTSFVAQRP